MTEILTSMCARHAGLALRRADQALAVAATAKSRWQSRFLRAGWFQAFGSTLDQTAEQVRWHGISLTPQGPNWTVATLRNDPMTRLAGDRDQDAAAVAAACRKRWNRQERRAVNIPRPVLCGGQSARGGLRRRLTTRSRTGTGRTRDQANVISERMGFPV